MAVAQRAERVPSGPQDRLKGGRKRTERWTATDQMYFSLGQRLVQSERLSSSVDNFFRLFFFLKLFFV